MWFFVNEGQQVGPVSDIQLDEYILAGKILPDTLIWRDGMPDWQPCGEVKAALALKAPVFKAAVAKSTGDTIVAEIVCAMCGSLQARDGALKQGEVWICADCKPVHAQQINRPAAQPRSPDTLVYAGLGARAVAKIIDILVMALPAVIVTAIAISYVLPAAVKAEAGGAFLLTLLGAGVLVGLEFAIYQIFFLPKYGATPGKRIMGLRVIRAGGAGVSLGRSAARFAGECINCLIPFFIGYVIAAFDPERRTVHDHIAGTRVIRV